MRAVIVDDEPLSRRAVRQLLQAHADVRIVGEYSDAIDAEPGLRETAPDVVFLDISMPGPSGLELAATRTGTFPLVVFITAHERFALHAFDVAPVDYLTKPLVQARLDRTLQRVRERLAEPAVASERRLAIPTRSGMVLLHLHEIDYVEADDVYATVHANGRRHLLRQSLDALTADLDHTLLRVHRSYAVRKDAVRSIYSRQGTRHLALNSGALIPVSRRRWPQIAAQLGVAVDDQGDTTAAD